jgi:cytochrome P450
LAELEVRVFFEEFLDRVESFQVGKPDRLRSNFIRGIKHLPVGVTL